jgi:hypothetical protein
MRNKPTVNQRMGAIIGHLFYATLGWSGFLSTRVSTMPPAAADAKTRNGCTQYGQPFLVDGMSIVLCRMIVKICVTGAGVG